MKKIGSKKDESPTQLIDARIEELDDWRGEMLSRLRALIKQADPEVVEEWFFLGALRDRASSSWAGQERPRAGGARSDRGEPGQLLPAGPRAHIRGLADVPAGRLDDNLPRDAWFFCQLHLILSITACWNRNSLSGYPASRSEALPQFFGEEPMAAVIRMVEYVVTETAQFLDDRVIEVSQNDPFREQGVIDPGDGGVGVESKDQRITQSRRDLRDERRDLKRALRG